MVKVKKLLPTMVAGFVLTSGLLFGTTANADEDELKAYGGWSESEGYFSNVPSQLGFSLLASSSPDSHTGTRLKKIDGNGDSHYAAEGITKWKDKYHYTTARMELTDGTVKKTSGRVWNYDYTIATSPYYFPGALENTEARTYWGY